MKILQVDAFTDRPYRGNPAAVCVAERALPEAWMQQVAQEMNLSETAFLYPEAEAYRLRWFTPTVEVDLCGHATLASAHVLWTEGWLAEGQMAKFQTRSGVLTAQKQGTWITLDFPASRSQPLADVPLGLTQALGIAHTQVSQNALGYLVEVATESMVRDVQPNLAMLQSLPVSGVIVTSKGDRSAYDFVSRFFAPQIGIDEDPVTGAAHCCLGPYWQAKLGRSNFLAYQASARGGEVKVSCQGDRVLLQGQAVTILRGELLS